MMSHHTRMKYLLGVVVVVVVGAGNMERGHDLGERKLYIHTQRSGELTREALEPLVGLPELA